MKQLLWIPLAFLAMLDGRVAAQDSKPTLDAIAAAMGTSTLKTITYSGTGSNFALGQSPNATAPWPRFNVTSYTMSIDYDLPAMRQEMVRTQGENPPRGGGGQPLAGEQRQIQLAREGFAWNLAGTTATPAPAALTERILQFFSTPHGFVLGAQTNRATVRSQTRGGAKSTIVSFTGQQKWKFQGTVNAQNLVEKVETWLDNPVVGDMPIETTYSDYQDFGGVKFPTKIVQKQGGWPTLDLTITEVKPNAPVTIELPANVAQAQTPPPPKVESQKIGEGVWYLTGGSHHSVLVEFKDHVAVIEGPQNEERSLAVIGEVKRLVPTKPIRYIVNTHQHFDHSGGLRTYAAEGATIVTHQIFKPYYEKVFATPRTLRPDRLAQSGKKAKIEAVVGQKVLTDGTRGLALHPLKDNPHNDGILIAYLPEEKMLIEADVFTPPAPNTPPPATPNPFSVNLYENIQRLKLDVNQIVPLHGRIVKLEDLLKAIGKATTTN